MRPSKKFLSVFAAAMAGVTLGSLASVPTVPAQGAVEDGAPKHMIAFFPAAEACPAGWAEALNLRGMTPVGTPTAGLRGVAAGGAPLDPAEEGLHGHSYALTIDLGSKGLAAAGGNNNDGAHPGQVTTAHSTSVASDNIPYVQYLGCVKQ